MKKTGIIILVIVLVLVIAGELFLFLEMRSLANGQGLVGIGQLFSGNKTAGQTAEVEAAPRTESPAVTPTPIPTEAPPTETPAPTQEPPTPTPEPTPTPTQGPPPTLVPVTPTPPPTLVPSRSGSCASDTGTVLNMQVDWKTEDLGDGTTRVTVTGKAISHNMDIGRTSVTVTLGSQSTTCRVEKILVSQNEETETELFSTTLDMATGATETLTADWNFNGTYSGVYMPHITAEDTVQA